MVIIRDTREKHGWLFQNNIVEDIALKTGDYSLKGFEDKICIERKKSVNELASCLLQKRFAKQIERMSQIPHSFLILEFSRSDVETYPFTADLPWKIKKKIRIRGNFILSVLRKYLLDYDIQTIFAGDSLEAEQMALSLFYGFYSKL